MKPSHEEKALRATGEPPPFLRMEGPATSLPRRERWGMPHRCERVETLILKTRMMDS